tara:strand:- start:148 stop:366 length:219 start_codon:yes stop_codon:yes gene_type:complete
VPVYSEPGKGLVESVIETAGDDALEFSKVMSGISLVKNTKLSPEPIDIELLSMYEAIAEGGFALPSSFPNSW